MIFLYMKMPVSVRIFSSFVVPVPGMEVILLDTLRF